MKRLMLNVLNFLFLSIAVTSAASAYEIDLIVPAPPGRLEGDFERAITPQLQANGFTVNVIVAGSCAKGYSLFKNSKKPTVTIASSMLVSSEECPLDVKQNNFMLTNILSGVVAICARPDIKDPTSLILLKKSVSIGLGGGDWPKPVVANLNPNFKMAVYSSSGDLAKGFAAGDTDFIITNMVRAGALMEAGRANCIATTSNTVLKNIPPAHKVFPNWKYSSSLTQNYAMIGANLTPVQEVKLRQSLDIIRRSPSWQAIAQKGDYNVEDNITRDMFTETSHVWALR
jgi:hypothetical protein